MSKKPRSIFVFGSNLAGRHGKGAALDAYKHHGALYGQGVGRQGNSYAIPTKDKHLKVLPLSEIKVYVKDFLKYAKEHPKLVFQVTKIGCGLAGYKAYQIAPFFKRAPHNCILPRDFVFANTRTDCSFCGKDCKNPRRREHLRFCSTTCEALWYEEEASIDQEDPNSD